jgi:hypothetical protein
MNVVFDMDGTLADTSNRQHLVANQLDTEGRAIPKDFKAFHDLMSTDLPVWPLIILFELVNVRGNNVTILTGRPESYRQQTVEWLANVGITLNKNQLVMRPESDSTMPDAAWKRLWLDHCAPEDRPDLVFEDRMRVVDMWRAQGILCAQVGPGNY